MKLSSQEIKMVCALERQIDNHDIKKLSASIDGDKFLKFEDGIGWKIVVAE